jgi:hypothetical protein
MPPPNTAQVRHPATNVSTSNHTTSRKRRRTSASLFEFVNECPDAGGIGPDVAAAIARLRADVDPRAALWRRAHPDDDDVLETEYRRDGDRLGKSTAFNLITGHLKPTRGRVFFHDRDITGMAPHDICQMGMGRSFQRTNIFPRLTVFENVQVAVLSHAKQTLNFFTPAKKLLQ